jgi:hypothetical protein
MASIHTKIASDTDVTMYKRIDERTVEVRVAADALTYIVVDHRTRKAVHGRTEAEARQNLQRLRRSSRFSGE